jgi:hypothetical protein
MNPVRRLHANRRDNRARGPDRQEAAKRSACDGQDHPFDNEQPREAEPSGAERRANGELAPALHAANEQQIRNVRTGNEQHECNRREQHD